MAYRVPIVRLDEVVINLDYFIDAYYDNTNSYEIVLDFAHEDDPMRLDFKTKTAALSFLDRIVEAAHIEVIDEDIV